eukprot:CAMPEP_0167767468 /NCGR_PEP_ID=MMETSP0110_2-20121227/16073_1 /TAXON_ID=629695 /ORGANISM="Gymnochlora sp., Strain CCMP2014" /LENGTH=583 /DNA_ID=CAMNT_0007655923 /DNA_START=121 /DNA_END=1872 /DNA_ORIENTATION=-
MAWTQAGSLFYRFGCISFGRITAVEPNGKIDACMRKAESFSVGPLKIKDLVLLETNHLSNFGKGLGYRVDGIIGYDIFRRCVVKIPRDTKQALAPKGIEIEDPHGFVEIHHPEHPPDPVSEEISLSRLSSPRLIGSFSHPEFKEGEEFPLKVAISKASDDPLLPEPLMEGAGEEAYHKHMKMLKDGHRPTPPSIDDFVEATLKSPFLKKKPSEFRKALLNSTFGRLLQRRAAKNKGEWDWDDEEDWELDRAMQDFAVSDDLFFYPPHKNTSSSIDDGLEPRYKELGLNLTGNKLPEDPKISSDDSSAVEKYDAPINGLRGCTDTTRICKIDLKLNHTTKKVTLEFGDFYGTGNISHKGMEGMLRYKGVRGGKFLLKPEPLSAWEPLRFFSRVPTLETIVQASTGKVSRARFLLDTGASGINLLMHPRGARELGVGRDEMTRETVSVGLHSVSSKQAAINMLMDNVKIPWVLMAGRIVANLTATKIWSNNFDISIGHMGFISQKLLSNFNVTFDFPRRRLAVQGPRDSEALTLESTPIWEPPSGTFEEDVDGPSDGWGGKSPSKQEFDAAALTREWNDKFAESM